MKTLKFLIMVFLLSFLGKPALAEGKILYKGNWTPAQKAAMSALVRETYSRLFSERFLACKNAVLKQHWMDGGAFSRAYGVRLKAIGQRGFLDAQIRAIISMALAIGAYPSIRVRSKFDPGSHWGRAHFSHGPADGSANHIIVVGQRNGRYIVTGDFDIELNSRHFGAGNGDAWVGVIAHEMLHNLLHKHPDPKVVGLPAAYTDDYEINAAQYCIKHHNRYRAGLIRVPRARCGGRPK